MQMSKNDSNMSIDATLTSLIKDAQNGNQTAFEALLNRYTPLIDSLARQFAVGSALVQDYEDLRQEAILAFYHALMRFNSAQEGVLFGHYAKICVKNRLISHLRTQRQSEHVILWDDKVSLELEQTKNDEDNPAVRVLEQENYEMLSRLVHDSLSAYENRIWWLYLSGRTAKEIAVQAGKDEKSVQNAIYRIRRKLREIIPNPS